MLRWALLALGAVVLGHGHLLPSALWFTGGTAVAYFLSLRLHPRRVCRSCGGSGRHRAAMFWWADRACTRCGGGSRHRRWGVQYLFPGRQTPAERDAKRAAGRRGAIR